MTSQLPDGSIITISGSGTSAADQVGGVPVKNLIIAGCVVGGAIIIGILGVYGYKFLRGGQRGTLEERKSKKGGWQRQAPRPRDEESPEGGTWDRDFAWNPVAMPTTPTLGKKPSSDSLYRAPPSASTPAYSGAPPSGPQPSWSMGTNGSSVSSANDLMAHLTHSINQGSNGFGGYPATEPSMAQISRGASNAELSALGFAPPAKASKPIPTAINTGKMARSSTAPQLNSANREEALRGTPMSIDVTGQVPGAGAPAQAPLPGTTSINTARAMSANYGSGSAANGGGRPKSLAVVHPGLKIEIPGRDGPKSTTEQNQRLARAQAGSVASVSRKPKAVGRSNTFSTSPTAQSDSAQMQARARDGTWAGRAQDMRASVYAEQGISRYGTDRIDRPVKAARPPKVLPVPSDPLLEMPPKRTASNKKLEGGVTWDAIVNVGEYGALRQPNGRPGGSSGGFA